uniref:Voltage-dependent T-type calcium channel subunit alpha n=1 Tax=Panagrolaimus sp. JU765 TaxID=591449 RepID=A0AC34QBU8_9BILA
MLQQPVAKDLRSFQSLSKFSDPHRRSVVRRHSTANRLSRKRLNTLTSNTESNNDVPVATSSSNVGGGGLQQMPSDLIEFQKDAKRDSLNLPHADLDQQIAVESDIDGEIKQEPLVKAENQRQTQIEWDDEADFIFDDDEDLPFPGFINLAFGCLKQSQWPRNWALQLVTNPWFDRLTMGVILLNCITLGMYRPCEDGADCNTYRCYVLSTIDHLIFGYFAVEMVIKIVALGFFGENTYLSDTWNRLDFFIVLAGIAEYLLQEYLGNINLTAIRTIRVLRPLRAVNRIPSMRILVNLLLDTLPMLGNVLLLCFFVFFIFGIVGVQLWAGLLRNRCVINLPKTNFTANISEIAFSDVSLTRYYIPEDTSLDYICSQPDASGIHTCQNLPPYVQNGIKCNLTMEEYDKVSNESCINWNIYYNECRVMHKNPFQGSVSFDNIGFAWIAIFLVISLEGWSDIMHYTQDAHSFWNWIYFVLLIVIGAFFMINLCLVVIATQFAETKRRETERIRQERKRMQSCASLTSSEQGANTSSKNGGNDSVYAALVKLIAHGFRRSKRYLLKRWRMYKNRNNPEALAEIENGKWSKAVSRRNSRVKTRSNGNVRNENIENEFCEEEVIADDENDGGPWSDISRRSSAVKRNSHRQSIKPAHEHCSVFGWMRNKVKEFVVCDHFTRGILVAILVNTLSMGIEYHMQPDWLTAILEYSNYFFTALFTFEMALKVIADGLFGYLSDGFNLFDGGIVVLSVLELFQEGRGGLSVLRTFRLLRILKLVRFMPALRKQLVVMLKTMDNVTVFFGLLILFIFIFSTLGMVLFGGKFCNHVITGEQCTCEERAKTPELCDCDRTNYDCFLNAVVTVFQILTQEDWNMVLFNGMSQTTPWAALYFVALMTFGNYVLFNLLVAILVEGFQESKDEERRLLEDEARKRAEQEEQERRHELEMLIAKTTSPTYLMQNQDNAIQCTCGERIISTARIHIERRISNASRVLEGSIASGSQSPISTSKSIDHGTYNRDEALKPRNSLCEPIFNRNRPLRFNRSSPYPASGNDSDSDEEQSKLTRRLNRHTSLVLPSNHPRLLDEYAQRQRINSWGGVHSLFNPHCPIHGRRALIEAYTREKLIKASQELHQALAEEEKRAEERKNTLFRRLLRKTCFYSRQDCSLFLFSPKNTIRIYCLKLTQKKWFDYTILAFIGINCITLAMERPSIPPKSYERMFLTISGYIFTIIFTVEMSMKVIANGCIIGPSSYFKDGWNILDGILVIISLVNVLMEMFVSGDSPKIFGVIRVLRLLRALRPLRVINRAPGVKLVVMTLISSLKPIGNIVLICCTFFIIFGILGVQLFKGMMYHCVGPDVSNITSKHDCLSNKSNRWVNHRYNFDNLGQALMSLFVLSSKDGWVSIMYQGIDAVGVDMQPIENYNEWRMIYFISFLLLVGFFVLNMFVGVVVENFHKCKEALEAEMKEKERQKRLERRLKRQQYEDQIMLNKKKKKHTEKTYWERYGPFRLRVHGIVTSKYFDLAIAAVIGINVISMAMEFYMMPAGLKYVLKALNYFFTAVFTLEAAMKLFALGFYRFFKERWNQLDMFIVILSIAGIIFEEFEALELPINPTIIRVMRVLRIARVLKLLKMAKGIRSLLDTVAEALPQVGNLGSLFFLLFFIFAALGVELFGKLECSEDHPCDGLGEHAHFKNFGMAFLTLFRIATGDNWNGIMKDALRDDCDVSDHCQTNCCVDPILAPCFFVIFVLISQFVLVNVVVAVLMKHLEESNKRDAASEAASGTELDLNRTDTDIEDTDYDKGDENDDKGELTLANIEKDLAEVEGQLAEDVSFGHNSASNLPPLDETAIPAIEDTPRRSSSSSMRNRNHRAAKPTLSLRSKRGSFKFALAQRQSASPGQREIVPLTTLSSKDEDSTPIELSNSDSDETVEQKTTL